MAKYEHRLTGSFEELLSAIESGILRGSMSANLEDGSDFQSGGIRCAVRVFERYSMVGSNRVSMSVTLIGEGENLFLTAITSGGSQAVFFKINTWGEESFLDCLIPIVQNYESGVRD